MLTVTARRLVLALAALTVCAGAASAQFVTFPRVGLSAAPDHYEPSLAVEGQDPFDVYVIAVPEESEPVFGHGFTSFEWAVLEACCGGAAEVVGETFNPVCQHEGGIYAGVTTTLDACTGGEAILLATLTLQMTVDQSGSYYIIGGPTGLAIDCDGGGVLMTDLILYVDYTAVSTPVEGSTLSRVKDLFRP
jgi:hypothetical protein